MDFIVPPDTAPKIWQPVAAKPKEKAKVFISYSSRVCFDTEISTQLTLLFAKVVSFQEQGLLFSVQIRRQILVDLDPPSWPDTNGIPD